MQPRIGIDIENSKRFMKPKFDAAYYQKFYLSRETRAVSPAEQGRLAKFVSAYLKYLEVPVTHIVDIGCGIGTMLKAFGKHFPKATLSGFEFSDYLVDRYGWQHGSVVDFQANPQADLLICNDVLGYLNKKACTRAIHNLADNTRGALYLSVLTSDDLAQTDTDHTDMSQTLRSADYYRNSLAKHFVAVGGGLYLKKPVEVPVWQLERID